LNLPLISSLKPQCVCPIFLFIMKYYTDIKFKIVIEGG
jgi:hypothetical protein